MADAAKIIEAAMMVREQNREGWERFVLALCAYSSATNDDMLRAEPSLVLKAQGMAIAIRDLCTILLKAPESYDKMRAAAHAKRAQNNERNSSAWIA